MAESKGTQYILCVLKDIGFIDCTKIADTLQGSIWRGWQYVNRSTKPKLSVIKITNRLLHEHSVSIVGDKPVVIMENILFEQSILKYVTQQKQCPKSIVKFHGFYATHSDYILLMEYGGISLFDFIINAHQLILDGKIDITHWIKVVKVIFKQMIECIDYIHSMNICHFDISLENFLINDVEIEIESNGTNNTEKVTFSTDDIQIKLCDFGLAQIFPSSKCLSDKFCGKTFYKSPECVMKKKRFDAKKNDVWMLGVCLFMMMAGSAPWNIAHDSSASFICIMNGYMMDVLNEESMLNRFDVHLINLLEAIFKYEKDRINLKKIKQHQWVKC